MFCDKWNLMVKQLKKKKRKKVIFKVFYEIELLILRHKK